MLTTYIIILVIISIYLIHFFTGQYHKFYICHEDLRSKWMVVKHPYIDWYTIVNIDGTYEGDWWTSRLELEKWLAENGYTHE